jgi:RNA polymerase sigma factor (sigma-70 family)
MPFPMDTRVSEPPGPSDRSNTLNHPVLTFDLAAAADPATRTPIRRAPTPMQIDEPEIASRERLFAELQPLIRRLVRQYGKSVELREDLPGVLYCRFCELVGEYDERRGIPLRPYLVRMLVTYAFTYSRTQWRHEARTTSFDALEQKGIPVAAEDPTPGWTHRLSEREALVRLPAAIAALPARQRQVVIWRYYEARSFDEIGRLLGVREASARSLLRHGLNRLRRQFAPDEPPLR